MAEHNDTGKRGEELARRHLEEQGFAIVETNWRRGKYEVDIIAYKEGLIVFAEVKTRSNLGFGNPEEFVDHEKQRAYVRMANAYVIKHQREEEVRSVPWSLAGDEEEERQAEPSLMSTGIILDFFVYKHQKSCIFAA